MAAPVEVIHWILGGISLVLNGFLLAGVYKAKKADVGHLSVFVLVTIVVDVVFTVSGLLAGTV